jgi:hypothetical protein
MNLDKADLLNKRKTHFLLILKLRAFYSYGQTDRHDKANSRFSKFCERAWKAVHTKSFYRLMCFHEATNDSKKLYVYYRAGYYGIQPIITPSAAASQQNAPNINLNIWGWIPHIYIRLNMNKILKSLLGVLVTGTFAKLRKTIINFVMYICMSVRTIVNIEQLGSHWPDVHEI